MDVMEIEDADEAVSEDERGAVDEVEVEASEAGGLGGFVSEHPLAALGGALAVGYVLGGGLLTPLTRRLFRQGIRLGFQLAVVPALERDVAGLASTVGETIRAATNAVKEP
jgi:hypothetical protein